MCAILKEGIYLIVMLHMSLKTNVSMKKQESNCICLGLLFFFQIFWLNLSLAMGVFS